MVLATLMVSGRDWLLPAAGCVVAGLLLLLLWAYRRARADGWVRGTCIALKLLGLLALAGVLLLSDGNATDLGEAALDSAGLPPVRMVWYDGGLQPPRPVEMADQAMPERGAPYLGDEGKLLYSWGGSKLLTEELSGKGRDMRKHLPRRSGTWSEWLEACKGGEPAGCAFDWAVPLTEAVLLGNMAIRTGHRLEWDAQQMKFLNHAPANPYLNEPYHNGWSLDTI
jgi:hypothetical protein